MRKNLTLLLVLFVALLVTACKSRQNTTEPESGLPEITSEAPEQEISDMEAIQKIQVDMNYHPEVDTPFNIKGVNVVNDVLEIEVSYGGGCKEHQFSMHTNGIYAKSYPPKLNLFLVHKGNGDMCKALLHHTLRFDLKDIQYQGSEVLHLQLNNYDEFVVYNY